MCGSRETRAFLNELFLANYAHSFGSRGPENTSEVMCGGPNQKLCRLGPLQLFVKYVSIANFRSKKSKIFSQNAVPMKRLSPIRVYFIVNRKCYLDCKRFQHKMTVFFEFATIINYFWSYVPLSAAEKLTCKFCL